jgi:hypothetical protein
MSENAVNLVTGTYQAAGDIPLGQDLSRPAQGPGSGGQ